MKKLLIMLFCFSCSQLKADGRVDSVNVNLNINRSYEIAYVHLKQMCMNAAENNYDVIFGELEYPENSFIASRAGNCYLANWLTGEETCLGSLDSSSVKNLISALKKGKVRIVVQK